MRSQSLPQKQALPNARSVVATLLQTESRSIRRSARRAREREGKSLTWPLLGWRVRMLRSFMGWRYNHKFWTTLKTATIYSSNKIFLEPSYGYAFLGERSTHWQWEWLEEKERRVCGNFESGQEGCTDDQERGKTSLHYQEVEWFNQCTGWPTKLASSTSFRHLPLHWVPSLSQKVWKVKLFSFSNYFLLQMYFLDLLKQLQSDTYRNVKIFEATKSVDMCLLMSTPDGGNSGQHERWNIYYYYWN